MSEVMCKLVIVPLYSLERTVRDHLQFCKPFGSPGYCRV